MTGGLRRAEALIREVVVVTRSLAPGFSDRRFEKGRGTTTHTNQLSYQNQGKTDSRVYSESTSSPQGRPFPNLFGNHVGISTTMTNGTQTGVFGFGRAVGQVVAFRWACGLLFACRFLFCPRVSRVVFLVFVFRCLSLFVAVFVYCFL